MIKKSCQLCCCIFFLWMEGNWGTRAHAQSLQRPAILGISYVAFQVKDLSKAVCFYGDLLGYTPKQVRQKDTQTERIDFKISDRQHLRIYSGLPDGQDERMLEIALEVADAEAMRLFLLGQGFMVPPTLSQERGGGLFFAVEDPEKHLIKFIQYPFKKASKNIRNPQKKNVVSNRILHVGITVLEVEKIDKFYANLLGFSEIWRGGRPDHVTNWINMRVPDGTDYFEYMLVSGPVSRQQLGVFHHVALQVPNMQQALDGLRKRASRPEPYSLEAPRIGRNNRWQLNLYDPDGTRIELMEPFPMR